MISRIWWGRVAIFASEFFFYIASVTVRWAQDAGCHLSSTLFVFVRFLVGFLVVALLMLAKRQPPRPRCFPLLLGRAFFYVTAVFCFFKAVETTTAAQGNILNMTYPIFTVVISWMLFRQQRDLRLVGMTFVAFIGMVLVIAPAGVRMDWNMLWGLSSGVLTGFGVIFLNLARQQNDTETVLFVVFGFGTALLFALFRKELAAMPTSPEAWMYLGGAGAAGVIGQYVMTFGSRYLSAVECSMISTTRILLAAFLGPLLTADAALRSTGWIGAALILLANAYFIFTTIETKEHVTIT